MRIFSVLNILLVGVVIATHQGAHLDNLFSPSQAKWVHAGAKIMLTGQIDAPTIGMITETAREQAAAVIPAQILPVNYTPPAAAIPASANSDSDAEFVKVIASLSS